jgi:hypothetical protein
VGGGQSMHALTARRALPVVRLPIPRGLPCLRAVTLDRCWRARGCLPRARCHRLRFGGGGGNRTRKPGGHGREV